MTASAALAQYARRVAANPERPPQLVCVVCAARPASGPWPDATPGPVCARCDEGRRRKP